MTRIRIGSTTTTSLSTVAYLRTPARVSFMKAKLGRSLTGIDGQYPGADEGRYAAARGRHLLPHRRVINRVVLGRRK